MATTTRFDAACRAGAPGHELSDKAPTPAGRNLPGAHSAMPAGRSSSSRSNTGRHLFSSAPAPS